MPKYRTWSKSRERFEWTQQLVWHRDKLTRVITSFKFVIHTNLPGDVILMQSTGLKDKNGVEIFEGDIVKATRFFGRADETGGFYEYDKELIGIVKQLEGAWVIDTGEELIPLWSEIEENIVIGNIYEHPELVEK
ncbi:YopX family protein [Streptococcus ruminantium]|uniref:YopX family protein n=1 Tax=Streptococcus ruminantium TaxID=1917441 RepID=UPI0012DBF6BF|nr:YopX family protein [Streptococcus ruminantium]